MTKYAEVAVDSFVATGDGIGAFDYIIPENYEPVVEIGMKVLVPFGKRNVEGYITDIKDYTDVEQDKLKNIERVLGNSSVFTSDEIALARWMCEEYMCSFIDTLKCILPPEVKDKNIKGFKLKIERDKALKIIDEMRKDKRYRSQAEALEKIACSTSILTEKELISTCGLSKSSIDSLQKKGIIESVDVRVLRDPFKGIIFERMEKPELTEEQEQVVNKILHGFKESRQRAFLIHGVTGSGKTEVYMRLIENALMLGKGAIMLVPEISLTPQTIERFKGRFERVAVIHSRLSDGERYDEWKRIRDGDVDVVVGARSAVFAPLRNLGIIIIDEEHENSYKSDMTPKYHARDVAYKRCEIQGAVLVLGSATPAIETYYSGENGKYCICTMEKRVEDKELPRVELVDMREEITSGNKTIFSRRLYEEIDNTLKKQQQAILFLNRRGFSTFVSCRKCGLVMKCPRCDVSLTYHADRDMLSCHYCGYEMRSPKTCPSCGSKYIKYFGVGTQKVESEVKRFFPNARILRMDMDTTSKKGSHDRIYKMFKDKKADILIGTQMVSKGLDFPGVSLVGIIAADLTLNIPDFRACERTFQLITQVAGRAGRGYEPGLVIVRTYHPENYSIQAAMAQNYQEFYHKEILVRESFKYPPFSDLINIIVSSNVEKEAIDSIKELTDKIREALRGMENITVLGPSPAPISKINTYYRWQTIIKCRVDAVLKKRLRSVVSTYSHRGARIKVNVDINPTNMI